LCLTTVWKGASPDCALKLTTTEGLLLLAPLLLLLLAAALLLAPLPAAAAAASGATHSFLWRFQSCAHHSRHRNATQSSS
jgi:hypothetical protein